MKKIRKMICIAAITLMACFACTACGTTYQEVETISQLSRNGMIPRHITKSHMQKILK